MHMVLDPWQERSILDYGANNPTHLGVRVPLLLVPALASLVPAQYLMKGDFYGHTKICIQTSGPSVHIRHYDLLNRTIFDKAAQGIIPTAGWSVNGPRIVNFGVLNFGMDGADILLPPLCLAVALNCGKAIPGHVRPADRMKILEARTPPVFSLESAGNRRRIAGNELARHGMQIVVPSL